MLKAMNLLQSIKKMLRTRFLFMLVMLALLLSSAKIYSAFSFNQDLDKLNRFMQSNTSQTAAMKVFREGRDFIQDENWSKAAERFNYFVTNFPKDKDVDAALYWLAYALKKQNKPREADQIVLKLLEKFPQSRWSDDARNMHAELAAQLGDQRAVDESINASDPETKIIALQSLFQGNPERAIAITQEILHPGSNANTDLKEAAVTMLGSHGGSRALSILTDLARSSSTDARLRKAAIISLGRLNLDSESAPAVFALLREVALTSTDDETSEAALFALSNSRGEAATRILLEVARSASNTEMRGQAIHWLGQKNRDDILDELSKIYDTEKNQEVKARVLHAYSQMRTLRARQKLLDVARNASSDRDLRGQAIHWLGEFNDDSILDELMRIYEVERNEDVRKQILHSLSQMNSPRAYQKLLEIARSGGDAELRRSAIFWLGQKNNEAVIQELAKIYDAERSTEIRASILHAYSQTNLPLAQEKLIAVARSGDDVELRGTAIHWLGQKNSDDSVGTLIQIYDAEKNTDIKSQILHALSQSRQKRALRKLMDVARSDPLMELRRAAIHWLGQSNDPEALKFLEEILK